MNWAEILIGLSVGLLTGTGLTALFIYELAKEIIEYKKKIIERLAKVLGEALFVEGEIERAFFRFLEEKVCDRSPMSYAKMRLLWMDFLRLLWEGKKH